MSGQNQGNNNNTRPSVAATAATAAIGAAVGYGAYKLFQSMFGTSEPQPNQQIQINSGKSEEQVNYDAEPKSPPFSFFQKDIYVVDAIDKLSYSLKELKSHCKEYNVLGFDCEWVSRWEGRQPIALLQLCTHRGLCILVQLSKLRHIPPELKAILEDSNIIKVGVAPFNDASFLYKDYGVHVASTLDLRYMAVIARCPPGGLEAMSEHLLGLSLDKSSIIRCSDWEASNLSREQIDYAATDVHAAIGLFKHFADKIAPEKGAQQIIEHHCLEYIDKNYFDI